MTAYAGIHPEPPVDLATRKPLIHELARGSLLSRFHRVEHGPLYFGRAATYRFDSPDKIFGVMYAGLDEYCAFIETFGQETGKRFLTIGKLEDRRLIELEIERPLRLIDLCSSGGLARIGADGGLCSGQHGVAQRWSAALRGHSVKADGILYPARHDPAREACAIFDCPAKTFKVRRRGSLLDAANAPMLAAMLDAYDFGVIP